MRTYQIRSITSGIMSTDTFGDLGDVFIHLAMGTTSARGLEIVEFRGTSVVSTLRIC
jgi:hypothetical protein